MINLARQKWKDINVRKSRRYAEIGLRVEAEIAEFLTEAKNGDDQPLFDKVVHHKRCSYADLDGKDITVYRKIEGRLYQRSFGVTISLRRFNKTQNIHPDVPLFYTPVGYNQEKLVAKVLALFEK